MPKSSLLASINARPAVHNGELVTAATVVQVSQLAMTAPYSGDFQIIDNGRLIVGEHPDLGDRVVVGKFGLFGYDPDGVNTFAVLSKQYGPWGSGDVFAGYVSGNYLHFDQSAGTLGVYSPAGAGFIAAADGSLYAGDTDGAHMRWNTATRAVEVRNGEDVKISLDANGDAMFDGMVYAQGGRIYGQMQVDGLFRAGDVDGPSVSLGRFERLVGETLVESGEIIATDDKNMPWFHVTAGGSTSNGGWFHLGGTGDYPQRLTYDGADLVFDGTLYARGGSFSGDMTVGGDLTITTGSITTTSVVVDNNGITFDAITGKYDGAGLKWATGTTEYLRMGTQVAGNVVVGTIIEDPTTGGTLSVAGDNVTIAGVASIIARAPAVNITGNGYWRPNSDSTTALQLQNAAGDGILVIDTTNKTVGIGRQSYYEKLEIASASRSIAKLSVNGGGEVGFVWQNEALGSTFANLIGGAGQVLSGSVAGEFIFNNRAGAIVFSADSGYTRKDLYVSAAGLTGIGNASPDSKLHVLLDDSATNAASQLLTLSHNTSGTVADGFGSRVLIELESSTTADQAAAALDVIWYEKTHASRKADFVWYAFDTDAREVVRGRGNGSAAAVGFLGATPAARRSHVADPSGGSTVDAEARTAINAILVTLETFGFHATS